jgi:hypothetical protein
MRKIVIVATFGSVFASTVAAFGGSAAIDLRSKGVATMAVYGDSPYGTSPTDTTQFNASPAFIGAINQDALVDLVVQIGDIHSGKQYCTSSYDLSIYDLWTSFQAPLVYTPGDNEWTDCHKVAEGGGSYSSATGQINYVVDSNGNLVDYAGGNPIANLDLVRSIFFSNPGHTLGARDKAVLSQAQVYDAAYPSDANYAENVIWAQSRTLFVAINLPGGSNNDNDIWYGAPTMSPAQAREIQERTDADLRWLDNAFSIATANGLSAVVIFAQADMWDPEKGVAHQAAFEPFIQNIAAHATAFGKSVLMLNGDSHVYQSSNPLDPSDALYYMHPYYNVPNFHRIVVHGSTLPLEYLRLTIDLRMQSNGSESFGPFSWQRVIP